MENVKLNIFEKISLWWRMEARYYHRDFANGVKNLIRWFPTIWKDRDWDDHFIWNIMIQKLKFQSKYIGDRDFHTRAKRDAEVMVTCVKLMERIKEDYYGMEYFDYHEFESEFVPTTLSNGENGYEYKTKDISERFDEFFAKYPRVYKRVVKELTNSKEEFDKHKIAFRMSLDNHNRAKRILFKMMETNIESWWD